MVDSYTTDIQDQPQTYSTDTSSLVFEISNLPIYTAQARAIDASFALTDKTGIPHSQFEESITNGQESAIRTEAASRITELNIARAKKNISNGPVSDDALRSLLKPQDPQSVVEEHYANTWMNHIFWPKEPDKQTKDSQHFWDMIGVPEEYDEVTKTGSQIIAKDKFLKTHLENIQSEGIIGPMVDQTMLDIVTLGLHTES